jgi:7-cyano-7-deazaguanine synthase in queuosine biosynthesis
MSGTPSYQMICNGAQLATKPKKGQKRYHLEWLDGNANPRNMTLKLSAFKSHQLLHISDRVLDLLELASLVYCGDRHCLRGRREEVEFHSWSRRMHFVTRVRDHEFWNRSEVQDAISKALCWMTGDHSYKFTFQPGHRSDPAHLFDLEGATEPPKNARVVLFSGGLDSLAGVVDSLESSDETVCLVSHRSQPGTIKTQRKLIEALERKYPGRIVSHPFTCTLSNMKAPEETQRTRAFLYCSIAFAVSSALSQSDMYIYENGITALNFPKRRDMMNARASRTAHPKTLHLLGELFALVEEKPVKIKNPFLFKTKTDAFQLLSSSQCADLVDSSTSCSRTYQTNADNTHCGCCTQCIDRRFAAFASESEQYDDNGIYAVDITHDSINDGETKTALIDFLRQAKTFAEDSVDSFQRRLLNELIEILDYTGQDEEMDAIQLLYELCRRHGLHIRYALKRLGFLFRDPFREIAPNCLFHLIDRGEHLRVPVELLAEQIKKDLSRSLPIAFRKNQPKDENDLNDKIQAYLDQQGEVFEREHPSIVFGIAKTKPDHSLPQQDLWIESKYIRNGTPPSKATDGIAADLTKYPKDIFKLFLIYDPTRAISDDTAFTRPFSEILNCRVVIIR